MRSTKAGAAGASGDLRSGSWLDENQATASGQNRPQLQLHRSYAHLDDG